MMRHILALLLAVVMVGTVAAQTPTPEPPNRVTSLTWSPSQTHLASGTAQGGITLWDVATRSRLSDFQAHNSAIYSLAWNPQQDTLASGSLDTNVKVWNPYTGQLLSTFTDAEYDISAVGWNPTGESLQITASSGYPSFWSWHVDTDQVVFTEVVPTADVMAWSPDRSQVAFGMFASILEIRDATDYSLLFSLGQVPSGGTLRGEQIIQLAWHPNGEQIVTGSLGIGDLGSQVVLWDINSQQKVFVLAGHDLVYAFDSNRHLFPVVAVWFSADGSQFGSLSGNGTIRIWNTSDGLLIHESQLGHPPIFVAAVSPDGTQLAYLDATDTLTLIRIPEDTP